MKKLLVIAFLLVCFGIGYFGLQKFKADRLIWLGTGLFTVGLLGLFITPAPKKSIRRYSK